MTIQQTIEYAFEHGQRVEVEWIEGWEDYSGVFGSLTDGKRGRFYVGRSTGVTPVYLTILKSNSWGGGVLYPESIKSIKLLEATR